MHVDYANLVPIFNTLGLLVLAFLHVNNAKSAAIAKAVAQTAVDGLAHVNDTHGQLIQALPGMLNDARAIAAAVAEPDPVPTGVTGTMVFKPTPTPAAST